MHAITFDQIGYQSGGRAQKRLVRRVRQPPPAGDGYADLIGAIAARADRDAFSALFEHFAPRVRSYMLRGGGEPQAAEEAA
jgi:RNA polymerase sigma-70 factor, ECF subfamily